MAAAIRTSKQRARYAVCIDDGAYPVDLERWKIYRVLPDPDAARHRMIRVVDESGEDYLYPERYFTLVTLPPTLRRRFRHSTNRSAK